MNLNSAILSCVVFIGVRAKGTFRPKATAFFVHYFEEGRRFEHLVTAEHVISGLLTKGHEIWIRVNLTNGESAELPIDHGAFRFHPNAEISPTDVAVAPIITELTNIETNEPARMDVRTLGLNGEESFVPSDEWAKRYVGLGTEIATVGLFRSHFGRKRNVPIVRVGNIAAMPEEPVLTRYAGYMNAYLVEARSIAGLSGSPVFALPELALVMADGLAKKKIERQGAALLGLMHGHFDVKHLNEDVVVDDEAESSKGIHTGIGIVIPVQKIIETIQHPELVEMRKTAVASMRKNENTNT